MTLGTPRLLYRLQLCRRLHYNRMPHDLAADIYPEFKLWHMMGKPFDGHHWKPCKILFFSVVPYLYFQKSLQKLNTFYLHSFLKISQKFHIDELIILSDIRPECCQMTIIIFLDCFSKKSLRGCLISFQMFSLRRMFRHSSNVTRSFCRSFYKQNHTNSIFI